MENEGGPEEVEITVDDTGGLEDEGGPEEVEITIDDTGGLEDEGGPEEVDCFWVSIKIVLLKFIL